MKWRWWRREPAAERAGQAERRATNRPQASSEPGWSRLPELQRTVALDLAPVAPLDTFTAGLTAHQNPSMLGGLGHLVDTTGPSGSVTGLVQPAAMPSGGRFTYASADALVVRSGARRPAAVQRKVSAGSTPDPASMVTDSEHHDHPRQVALVSDPIPEAVVGEERVDDPPVQDQPVPDRHDHDHLAPLPVVGSGLQRLDVANGAPPAEVVAEDQPARSESESPPTTIASLSGFAAAISALPGVQRSVRLSAPSERSSHPAATRTWPAGRAPAPSAPTTPVQASGSSPASEPGAPDPRPQTPETASVTATAAPGEMRAPTQVGITDREPSVTIMDQAIETPGSRAEPDSIEPDPAGDRPSPTAVSTAQPFTAAMDPVVAEPPRLRPLSSQRPPLLSEPPPSGRSPTPAVQRVSYSTNTSQTRHGAVPSGRRSFPAARSVVDRLADPQGLPTLPAPEPVQRLDVMDGPGSTPIGPAQPFAQSEPMTQNERLTRFDREPDRPVERLQTSDSPEELPAPGSAGPIDPVAVGHQEPPSGTETYTHLSSTRFTVPPRILPPVQPRVQPPVQRSVQQPSIQQNSPLVTAPPRSFAQMFGDPVRTEPIRTDPIRTDPSHTGETAATDEAIDLVHAQPLLVQRDTSDDPPVATESPAPSAAGTTPQTPTPESPAESSSVDRATDVPDPAAAGIAAPAPAPTGAPADLDELARRLFEPLSARIRAELWLDRERAGLITDLRP